MRTIEATYDIEATKNDSKIILNFNVDSTCWIANKVETETNKTAEFGKNPINISNMWLRL